MAEEQKEQAVNVTEGEGEVKDRGLFDILGKKEEKKPEVEDDFLVSGVEKIHIEEGEITEKKEEKKQGILDKLHRSNSSSSSSSDEEEIEGEGGVKEKIRRKKKTLKEKIEQKLHGGEEKGEEAGEKMEPAPPVEHDTTVVVEETAPAPLEEEKKGFLDKIKEKLPGHHKKPAEAETGDAAPPPPPPPPPAASEQEVEGHEGKEKKGFLGKIMEKLPGYHKNGGEEGEKSSPVSH